MDKAIGSPQRNRCRAGGTLAPYKARVSQAVAMRITGHRTASVYRRYRITPEADLREALAATQASVRERRAASVTALGEARKGRG